ncbi:alanine/ornithine racemase family PLP-dependent enzyme [Aquimarina muelleri]|uniref:alanine/ornithine racemase family PLP-dependent enzyme n=1 Tax=Aquimarina muelleri TaxID=279356 RepID=UPI003F686F6A
MGTPRLEINHEKIAHNCALLTQVYAAKKISICAVTKGVCGNIMIAQTLVSTGVTMLADSKVSNLKKMREGGILATFLLIGTPMLSQARSIIKWADISNNSELVVIEELARHACIRGVTHKIILMVEMGDLREGIMPSRLDNMVKKVLKLKGIKLVGIGTNLACFGGIQPSKDKMELLSVIAECIEQKYHISLPYISGGNSANYGWFKSTHDIGKINHLRLGESILLGVDPVNRRPIPNLYTDVFNLVAEVTELKIKPSVPYGKKGQNAFGHILHFPDRGKISRAILGIGLQDVDVSGLKSNLDISILGVGSDHTIIDPQKTNLKIGDEVSFSLNYAALLSAMTSPYVEKINIVSYELEGIL